MDDTNKVVTETLDEMTKRLTPKVDDSPREFKTKTHTDQNAEDKKLEKDLAEMEKTLPKFRGTFDGEKVEATDSDWKKFDDMRYTYLDGSPVCERDKGLILQMLEMKQIIPVKAHESNFVIDDSDYKNTK